MANQVEEWRARITSTYVENTKCNLLFKFAIWDHLHIRGEYNAFLNFYSHPKGSPPHTWRILQRVGSNLYRFRITSTYVENT